MRRKITIPEQRLLTLCYNDLNQVFPLSTAIDSIDYDKITGTVTINLTQEEVLRLNLKPDHQGTPSEGDLT